jgi:MraZ protein
LKSKIVDKPREIKRFGLSTKFLEEKNSSLALVEEGGRLAHVNPRKCGKMASKTLVLHGEYELVVDEKNRLVLPAAVRHALDPERDGEEFFVVIGENNWPWLFPERAYEEMVAKLANEMSPGEDKLAFEQLRFSMSEKVGFDKQGRLNVPPNCRKRTPLGREITMIGVRNHLELWNRADWEARREYLYKNYTALADKQREAEKREAGKREPERPVEKSHN